MPARSPCSAFRRFALIVAATASVAPGPARAREGAAMTDVIQVLADITLIDGACRDDAVNFGVAFRFAAQQGVPDVSVMPGGSRRAEFEAALRSRGASFGKDELCGEIAANYAEALPGSVIRRPGTTER